MDPGSARIDRAGFGGVGSPATTETQGTGIPHSDGEPCRERLYDNGEHERAA